MTPFRSVCWTRAGSSFGSSPATARITPRLNAAVLRAITTVRRARRRSLRIRRRRATGGAPCFRRNRKSSSLAPSGRDQCEHVLAVPFDLRRPEAAHGGEIRLRPGLRGGKRAEGLVVEDDVRGDGVGARP